MLKVTLVGDRELVAKLDKMPNEIRKSLKTAVTKLALGLQRHIVADKLSGQVLNVKTGALRRSIFSKVEDRSDAVIGKVASSGDVKYAAIHEFGGVIPPHDVVPVRAEALHFFVGGHEVFAKRVHIPQVQMPQRSFMRTGLADMKDEITATLSEAVLGTLKA